MRAEDVLQRDRDPGEWGALAPLDPVVREAGLLQRQIRCARDERLDAIFDRLDAPQMRLGQFHAAQLAPIEEAARLVDREIGQVLGHSFLFYEVGGP